MKWSKNLALGMVKDVAYNYSYDPMNRITAATFKKDSIGGGLNASNAFSESGYSYDFNGNIQGLTRKKTGGHDLDVLTYNYGSGSTLSNKLLYVTDGGDDDHGFIDGNKSGNDYDYDANGNMTQDKNKGINAGGIVYNYLNLPDSVKKSGEGYIKYIYDAGGRKLRQEVYNTSNILQKASDYAGEFFYENDTLKFINHEEGRIVMTGVSSEYQYNLKDHLGNVRMTFTTTLETEQKTATYEDANSTSDQANFLRYSNSKRVYATILDHTNGVSPGYSERLNGSANEKYGLARSMSVMPGDTVKLEVYAKYLDPNTSNWNGALATLASQISAGASGVVVDGASYSTSTSSFPYSGAGLTIGSTGSGPKAFLNWLVFDRNFSPKDGGYVRMSTAGKETGTDVEHEKLSTNVLIKEPGYVYVYLSNEEDSDSPVEVYFDDLKVTQVKGPVMQTDDYYPFGLRYNSYSRENSAPNKLILFQGQEHIDDLGLNWDSFKWRNHQPEIGRFFNVDPLSDKYVYNSPYAFSENQVTGHVELEGLEKFNVTLRPVISDRKFNSLNDSENPALKFSINLKNNNINYRVKYANLVKGINTCTNKDGSTSISGVVDFQHKGGLTAFRMTINNNIEKDNTINVQSNIVGENKAPLELIMTGTSNDKEDLVNGNLVNVVPRTDSSIPGLNLSPDTNEDSENLDFRVKRGKNDDVEIQEVKESNESKFKLQYEVDEEKSKVKTHRKK